MQLSDGITTVIDRALKRCHDFLVTSTWHGRENELVNLFAQHCLPAEMQPGGCLQSQSQVAVEVAVPQVTNSSKKYVRKDLVIWPEPLMTAWSGIPAAIIEWKRDQIRHCSTDIEWLEQFTERFPMTVGYSVCGFLKEPRGISFTRVQCGVARQTINLRQ